MNLNEKRILNIDEKIELFKDFLKFYFIFINIRKKTFKYSIYLTLI
jgi:hypothetical protein